tara:strand:+ start:18 stop:698 length:681 start_codon:yes stop_codon:yes gene_type:complete
MKKLIYLFLTVLIVACSSDDDSNGVVTLNAQFVGSWLLEFDDDEGGSVIIEFNADGTGSDTEIYDGETDTDFFTWSTTSTQLTVTYAPDDVEVVEYNFITNDQVRIINGEGIYLTLNRIVDNNDINQNLVGTWAGDFVDPENNEVYGNTTVVLNADSTGSVLSVFTANGGEVYSSTISWSSTTTTITFVYDDGNEDDVLTYTFITDDQVRVTDTTDGFEVILNRVN